MIYSDKMRLKQVILNYQSNALKFSKSYSDIWIICQKIRGNPDTIKITVVDSGYGIKQEDQDKLFKIFGYLERTQNVNKTGVGLGLYITKKIVEQFEGTVGVESELGMGSKFSLTF